MRPLLGLLALCLATSASAQDADRVTMTLDDFLALYEQGKDRPKDPEAAPRAYSIAQARYVGDVRVEDGEPTSVVFDARLRLEIHKAKGWVRAPLISSQVALIDATIDGKPAPLVIDGGHYTLVTDRHGSFDVKLRFAAQVSTSTGASSFAFPLVASGATDLELSVPAADALDFTVANARLQSDRVARDRRIVEAALPSGGQLSVRWQREIPEEDTVEAVASVHAEVYTLASVGDGVLRATATVQHQIRFAPVDAFAFDVPAGMTVLDVRGAGLRDWTVTDSRLDVSLNYAAEGSYGVAIDLERVVAEGSQSLDAPLLEPVGVERAKGWVGIASSGNLEIGAGEVSGATPVDVRTLPASILGLTSQPVLLGYKYLGSDAEVPLVITSHDDVEVLVTLLDQAEATTMFTRGGRRLTSVRYEVRNNRRQYLRLALPDGAELWSSAVAGKSVQPAKAADGAILIPLVRSQSAGGTLASFGVELVYVESATGADERGRARFEGQLPQADVPTTYVAWTVYAPDEAKLDLRHAEGSLREVDYLSHPLEAVSSFVVSEDIAYQRNTANAQAASGGLGTGAAPVMVRLPLEGTPVYFEKLLAMDERLWVGFDVKGLR